MLRGYREIFSRRKSSGEKRCEGELLFPEKELLHLQGGRRVFTPYGEG